MVASVKMTICQTFMMVLSRINGSQTIFTCWKLIIETPEQGVKYVQSWQ